MNKKYILFLSLIFILINSIVYYTTDKNEKQRIQLVLDDNLNTLKTHYDILLQTQETIAQDLYETTIEIKEFTQILSLANTATTQEKKILRARLQKILTTKYSRAKKKGILQYHFVLRNNESFLRMHKPNKSGDDLASIREDFKYTNETKKPARGFMQGRTAHGFRNVFPIFDNNNKYIGAMEVSFSSANLQWYLNHISKIHTHFLVNKDIFNISSWHRDDVILNYSQSKEYKNYMIAFQTIHNEAKCLKKTNILNASMKASIDLRMEQGTQFSIYVQHNNTVSVFSFLPIQNLNKQTVAWIVSFENSPFIEMSLKTSFIIRILSFSSSLLLIYFLILQKQAQNLIQKERDSESKKNKLLDVILNTTDDIMFITDLKNVFFSNKRFKKIFQVYSNQTFNKRFNHNVLNIFTPSEGCIDFRYLDKDETAVSFIQKTAKENRIVAIKNENKKLKKFTISIAKTNSCGNFLVTLSDITKIKELQTKTEKKVYIDSLTQVYNRNKFDEILQEEFSRVQRYNHPLSLAIIDIDNFKNFNDKYGHLIGDEVLITMAQNVNKNTRKTDTFARWGGEEFMILFKETNITRAKSISKKLKSSIQENIHPIAGNITASFGITQYKTGDTLETLFKRCDDALYIAKNNGRNRIEIL